MDVQMVQETVSIPKEAKDVKDLIVGIVKGFHNGKSITTIAIEELPALEAAIAGFNQLSAEAKTPQIAVLGGLLGGQIGEVLMTPKAAV